MPIASGHHRAPARPAFPRQDLRRWQRFCAHSGQQVSDQKTCLSLTV